MIVQQIILLYYDFKWTENTIGSILVPVLIFISGLLAAGITRTFTYYRERRSYQKSVLLILRDFRKECDIQARKVSESLLKTGLTEGNDFMIEYIPISSLEYLGQIDFNTFMKNFTPLFCRGNFSKAVSKLFSFITLIKIQNESLGNFRDLFDKSYTKNEDRFNKNLFGLRKIHDELAQKYDNATPNERMQMLLPIEYSKIFYHWNEKVAKRDMKSTYTHIVLPILNVNKNFPTNALILDTNNLGLLADIAYQNIQKGEALLKERFNSFVQIHRDASRMLKVIIKILD